MDRAVLLIELARASRGIRLTLTNNFPQQLVSIVVQMLVHLLRVLPCWPSAWPVCVKSNRRSRIGIRHMHLDEWGRHKRILVRLRSLHVYMAPLP
jgi:hypothetical protein